MKHVSEKAEYEFPMVGHGVTATLKLPVLPSSSLLLSASPPPKPPTIPLELAALSSPSFPSLTPRARTTAKATKAFPTPVRGK